MAWSPDHATGPTEGLQQPPPPANLLDRVFAGLDFDPLAPRAGRLAGVGLAPQLGGATYQGDGTSPLSVTDSSPQGATAASAPPAESDEGGGGGGGGGGGDGGDEPVAEAKPQEPQINWEAVAIAYAENNGSLKFVDGEVDITAALTDLAKALTDRAESVGIGEAKRQIIGENPTVDLYVDVGTEGEFGEGESMAMSGGSGSGCGQSQGSNQAPFAYDDEFVVSAIQPTTIDNNGVLWNDQTQPNETLTAVLSTGAQPGSVTLNPDGGGGFTYTPPVPPQGNDTFFYQAFDAVLYSCPAKVSLGMPLVDLDTDSDNNGVVDQSPGEEAIEMTNPGKVVAYNKDDDNGNGLPDYQDASAPLGDNDLVLAKYTSTPTGILDPTGYKFKLIVNPPSRIKVWKNPQKGAMPLTWTHGAQGAPPLTGDFYVEGLAKGEATVEYQMLTPGNVLLHSDIVKFTVMDVNLAIGDGQQTSPSSLSLVSEALEESRGAFTVANLNDTDGDGRADNTETNVRKYSHVTTVAADAGDSILILDSVAGFVVSDSIVVYDSAAPMGPNETHTITAMDTQQKRITLDSGLTYAAPTGRTVSHRGRNEVDLMPLRIYKPTTLVPGVNSMTLTFPPGAVTIWQNTYKGTAVPLDGAGTKVFDVTTMPSSVTYWVELLVPSSFVRDVVLNLTYAGTTDTVRTTGVWTDSVLAEHDTFSASQIIADSNWSEMGTNVSNLLFYFGGTGIREIEGLVDGFTKGVMNAILLRFHVVPYGIQAETAVKFDITRAQENGVTVNYALGGFSDREYFPIQIEESNDDPSGNDETDEDAHPSVNGNFYSIDAPGAVSSFPINDTLFVMHGNWREWVRVSFNGVTPVGEGIQGSRMSPFAMWHVSHKLVPASSGELWRRSTGADPSGPNDPEVTGVNDVGLEHIPFGDPPYN